MQGVAGVWGKWVVRCPSLFVHWLLNELTFITAYNRDLGKTGSLWLWGSRLWTELERSDHGSQAFFSHLVSYTVLLAFCILCYFTEIWKEMMPFKHYEILFKGKLAYSMSSTNFFFSFSYSGE